MEKCHYGKWSLWKMTCPCTTMESVTMENVTMESVTMEKDVVPFCDLKDYYLFCDLKLFLGAQDDRLQHLVGADVCLEVLRVP